MGARGRTLRYFVIATLLLLGVLWAFASARQPGPAGYPAGRLLADAPWLQEHLREPGLLVVDVRDDKDFDGRVIPGAVRMPWTRFRRDDPARGIGGLFVGIVEAQQILGDHGIGRENAVVLYDSLERDGGATASYVFWVLDLLGHRDMRLLERGIDAWVDAGGEVSEPRKLEPVLYQAPRDEIRLRRSASADFILDRLGDPYYQILDVRSREEYLGEKADKALTGGSLKLGHIPTAVNVDYTLNWSDPETKAFKSITELRELYRGLEPTAAVITYCHSARRGSFGYFVLRLMGFEDVMLYEPSWFEWGNPDLFYPVETVERKPSGASLNRPVRKARATTGGNGRPPESTGPGGYVSCGG